MHAAAQAAAADAPLQLEVFLNVRPTNLIAAFTQRPDGSFSAPRGELAEIGLKVPAALANDAEVPLQQLPGVSFQYDEPRQAMLVTASPDAQEPEIIAGRPWADIPPPQRPPNGALLNYTVLGAVERDERSRSTRSIAAALDARAFGPWGVLEQGWTSRFLDAYQNGQRRVRLNTTYTYDMPETLRTFQMGDVITGGFSWTRPIRMGGVKFARSFALRPDLITTPLPTLAGTAATPSTLDLYVNGVRSLSSPVRPGPFRIDNPPLLLGAGQARLVLRDAVGYETVAVVPFYTSTNLLAPGLTDYSGTIGFARRGFGVESSDYDDSLAANGSVRMGLTPKLTVEAHAEATKGLTLAGGGAAFGLGGWGVASVAAAGSHSDIGNGKLGELSLESRLRVLTVLARVQRASDRYRDLASWTAAPSPLVPGRFRVFGQPRELVQLSAAVPLGRQTSLSMNYVRVVDQPDDRTRVVGVSLSKSIGRANIFASYLRSRDRATSSTVFVGLSLPLGDRVTLSSGLSRGSGSTGGYVEAARHATDVPGDVGWSVLAGRTQGQNEARGIVRYVAPFADLEANVYRIGHSTSLNAYVDGSVAWLGKGVHFGRTVDDSFAMVDVGVPGAIVLRENRRAGVTGRDGELLVRGLSAFNANRIAVDPASLPVDAQPGATQATAVPFRLAPVRVDLRVRTDIRGAVVVLVDDANRPIPVGSRAVLGDGTETVVGYGGETYVEGLQPQNELRVTRPDGSTCIARFAYQDTGLQPRIGPVACVPAGGTP